MDLNDLFAQEPHRLDRLTLKVGAIHADFSKQAMSLEQLDQALSDAAQIPAAVQRLLRGEAVNTTENRPALHSALRADAQGLAPDSYTTAARRSREAMYAFVNRLRAGSLLGATGKAINTIVNVGIGGSDLGPRLAVHALKHLDPTGPRIENLNNVDGHAAHALLPTLDPERTLIAYVSKSFTTQETQANLSVLRRWLHAHLGEQANLGKHLCVVTSKPELALAMEVPEAQIFPMFDWVGGRYSIWSTVGLSLAAAIGSTQFSAFLEGARELDEHFATAPLAKNLPVMGALIELHQRKSYPARAVIPYDSRLSLLPEYLQQLEMESNGKSVQHDGSAVLQPTNALVFGAVGTNAQHAFFQQLHQGTDPIPVEFIGVVAPDHPFPENHRALLANMLAQSAALLRGKSAQEAEQDMLRTGMDPQEAARLAPHRTFPGKRPSTTLLLDRLDAHSLGNLLAYYEHKVYVAGVLLNINSFDQWGVELGKVLTTEILPSLSDGHGTAGLDPSTQALIGRIRR